MIIARKKKKLLMNISGNSTRLHQEVYLSFKRENVFSV